MTAFNASCETREVGFKPWILVAAKDYAGFVDVEKENGGVGWRGLQQMMFHGEVEEGVAGVGNVDLYFARWMRSSLC